MTEYDAKQHAASQVAAALEVLLDQVDFTVGNCGPTELVAATLPVEVIALCRSALSLYKIVNKEKEK